MATPMVMAEKVTPIEETDVVDEVMAAEAVGTAEEGEMLISKKSKLPHSNHLWNKPNCSASDANNLLL